MIRFFISVAIFLLWMTYPNFGNALENQKSGEVKSEAMVEKGFPFMQAEIVKFYTEKSWYEYKSSVFITEFSNTGESDLRPQGTITIKNWFGNEVDKIEFNQNGLKILSGQTLKIRDIYSHERLLQFLGAGKYTAELSIVYNPGPPLKSSLTFWVVPWRILFVLFIILIAYIIMVIFNQHKIKIAFHKINFKPSR